MTNADDTANLLDQLAAHRRTLAILLRQRADLGAAYAPPGIHTGIAEARAAITRLKAALRERGGHAEDHADDQASPEEDAPPPAPPARGRQHTQTISDHAQVGVAIAGDVYGPISVQMPSHTSPPLDLAALDTPSPSIAQQIAEITAQAEAAVAAARADPSSDHAAP